MHVNEDPHYENSIFNKINDVFDQLLLASIVEDRIICLYGGIGETLKHVEDIDTL